MSILTPTVARLRLLVGYLGEKPQSGWWTSQFLGTSSMPFLAPVFPRSTLLAQYRGVCEAALLVHDEYIGVGTHLHLYRMPDAIEREAANAVNSSEFKESMGGSLQSVEAALQTLKTLAASEVEGAEGPIKVGCFTPAQAEDHLAKMASYYHRAFLDGYRCFPFLRDA